METELSPEQPNIREKIVDFQDESKVIGFLKEQKQKLDIIAITGMAGIGKTTFARKIFENPDMMNRFKLRIWIHVSENFNSTEAFRHILKEITRKETFITNEGALIASIRGSLDKKEFLLVIDDVWTKEDWDKIKSILPDGNEKGKVLLTTRQETIATEAHVQRAPHRLNKLELTESLKLLKFQVFGDLGKLDEKLEKVGLDIATKCGGVPLIIMVIGGILKGAFTKTRTPYGIQEEWEKVAKNVNKFIGKDPNQLIARALELSYKRLDHDKRICFLYTGLFPEKHDILVSTLTQLWIAEGFVQQKDGESLEENAKEILDTLIHMNLLTVTRKDLEQVKACRVHDMVRLFCRTKAIEEKLFRVIKESNEGPEPQAPELPDLRRLCFDSDPSMLSSQYLSSSRVRSILCFYEKTDGQDPVTLPVFNNLLRVLNCRSTRLKQFPDIKNLILLKHITLFIENLKVLPEEISQLVNLQTLIVDTSLGSITVKVNIWKMVRLRCLKTKSSIVLDGKNWKGRACGNLQTICRLSPRSCKVDLSKRASNLKKLGIRGLLSNLVDTMFLRDFTHLEKLMLINDVDVGSTLSKPMILTKADCFPQRLKSLTLSKTYLEWDRHMPMLAKIEKLKVLKLKDNAFIGKDWIAKEDLVFDKLQFLLIEKLELVKWEASDTYFPNLRSLVINNCEKLLQIPESLTKYFETLEIDRVSKSVVESAKKIKEKQDKQNQNSNWEVQFKLTIGPGCDQAISRYVALEISVSCRFVYIYVSH